MFQLIKNILMLIRMSGSIYGSKCFQLAASVYHYLLNNGEIVKVLI